MEQALIGTRSTKDDCNLECKSEVLKKVMRRLAEVQQLLDRIPTTDNILCNKLHCQVKVYVEDVNRENRHITSLKSQTSSLIERFEVFSVDQNDMVKKYMDGMHKKKKYRWSSNRRMWNLSKHRKIKPRFISNKLVAR